MTHFEKLLFYSGGKTLSVTINISEHYWLPEF